MDEKHLEAVEPSKPNKRPEWSIWAKIAFMIFGFGPAIAFVGGCIYAICWAVWVASEWPK